MGMIVNPYLGSGQDPNPNYLNIGGTGDRTALITVTTRSTPVDTSPSAGTLSNLVDGAIGNNSSDSIQHSSSTRGLFWKFDFGSGNTKKITELTLKLQGTSSGGNFIFMGSNDDLNWYGLVETPFSITSANPKVVATDSDGGFRYYMLFAIDGNINTANWFEEIEFKIAAAAAAVPSQTTGAYRNHGGRGPRSWITVTTTLSTDSGSISNIVDGVFPDNATSDFSYRPSTGQSGKEVVFDFGVGAAKKVTEWQFEQQLTVSHGTWQLAGSNDGSTWTDIGSSFTLGGAVSSTYSQASGNTTAYRYYKIYQVSGSLSLSLNYWKEIMFKIGE